MEDKQVSIIELLCETHIGLERQGPGSAESTIKALRFIDTISSDLRIADLGCGTGGQTMILAQHTKGTITGLDQFPQFIDRLNLNAEKLGLQERVKGVVGSMEDVPFQKEELDVIWSEGAIDNIGFEKGIRYWNRFLKKNGYIAVTAPSWLTAEHPGEVEKFWLDAGSRLNTIEDTISVMQKAGYSPVAAFTLPETDWIDNYLIPREAAEKALSVKYGENKTVEAYIQADVYEAELYAKYKKHYGYVFYIGKKV